VNKLPVDKRAEAQILARNEFTRNRLVCGAELDEAIRRALSSLAYIQMMVPSRGRMTGKVGVM
jgi:hypothetical protein